MWTHAHTHTHQAKDEDAGKLEGFWATNSYVRGSYTEKEAFENLNREIQKLEAGFPAGNRLFYLALPPSVFAPVTTNIKEACMSTRYLPRHGLLRQYCSQNVIALP